MKRLRVYDEGAGKHVLLRGPIRHLLSEYRQPAVWSNIDRGWWLRRERLPDLMAQAAESGYAVRVHRAEQVPR